MRIGSLPRPKVGKRGILPKHIKAVFAFTKFEYLEIRVCIHI